MRILGVTGPTGAGKSTLAMLAGELGFFCIDADKVSREVTVSEYFLLKELRIAFGNEIIKNGVLDRAALARKAFKNEHSKQQLERIIFPYIKRKITDNIKNAQNAGYKRLLLDAPTLFESGLESVCDKTLAVLADREVRKQRILKRDSMTEADAEIRLSAGKPDEFYFERADVIIYNNGEDEQFKKECLKLLKKFSEYQAIK